MTGKDTRTEPLKTLRDLVLVGNMMAMKAGDDPNNLANTWDELVTRLHDSGLLEKLMMLELYGVGNGFTNHANNAQSDDRA